MYPEIGSKRNLGASGSGSGTRSSGSGSRRFRFTNRFRFSVLVLVRRFASTGGVLASTSGSTSSGTEIFLIFLLFFHEFFFFLLSFCLFCLSYSSRSYFSLEGRRVLSFSPSSRMACCCCSALFRYVTLWFSHTTTTREIIYGETHVLPFFWQHMLSYPLFLILENKVVIVVSKA